MSLISKFSFSLMLVAGLVSCVSNKKYTTMQEGLQKKITSSNQQLAQYDKDLNSHLKTISNCETNLKTAHTALEYKQEQINDLKAQLADAKTQRDKQLTQVGDLTVISQSANQNMKETLSQLEKKDKYIQYLQAAKSKADSINLALAVNLKGVLSEGIEDKDVEIKLDKTVVFINLSDKMLYKSGSANLTPKANEVLGKIARIIESRPELEVMVEGYTDNVPVKKGSGMEDNWDLSVKRSTAVVRALQKDYNVNPNRLIAAGRGEYNALASNDTAEGKATNRRTRIIILPKLNQFYDLLNPTLAK